MEDFHKRMSEVDSDSDDNLDSDSGSGSELHVFCHNSACGRQ